MSDPWWHKGWDNMTEAERLAAKLADAGLSEDAALEWVREIQAEAWEDGWYANDGRITSFNNPYKGKP